MKLMTAQLHLSASVSEAEGLKLCAPKTVDILKYLFWTLGVKSDDIKWPAFV